MKKSTSNAYRIKVNGQEVSETDLFDKINTDDTFREQLGTSIQNKLSDLDTMENHCLQFYDKGICKKIVNKPRKIYGNLKKKINKAKIIKGKSEKKTQKRGKSEKLSKPPKVKKSKNQNT